MLEITKEQAYNFYLQNRQLWVRSKSDFSEKVLLESGLQIKSEKDISDLCNGSNVFQSACHVIRKRIFRLLEGMKAKKIKLEGIVKSEIIFDLRDFSGNVKTLICHLCWQEWVVSKHKKAFYFDKIEWREPIYVDILDNNVINLGSLRSTKKNCVNIKVFNIAISSHFIPLFVLRSYSPGAVTAFTVITVINSFTDIKFFRSGNWDPVV